MQEINLLQNKLKDKTNQLDKNNRTVLIGSIILLVLVTAGGLVLQTLKNGALDKAATLEQENASIQRSLDQQESQLAIARGFQAQTKNILTLLNNHVIWTDLMNDLAASTFATSKSMRFVSDTTGKITIEGITPTYTDLGKAILALETSDSLESVRLINTTKSSDQESGVQFFLELLAKTSVLTTN
jgi:Tfp pilus assembly protein PilN